jgi:hypothetical protein
MTRVLRTFAVFLALGIALVVSVLPTVQAPGRAATVGPVALRLPPDWEGTEIMKTIDRDPGGELRFDPKTGRIRVFDHNKDGHYVRGEVRLNGKLVASARAGEKGKDDIASISNYAKNEKYEFKVCLGDRHGVGYCNISHTWPEVEFKENHCASLDTAGEKIECMGGVEEYCHDWWEVDAMFPEHCVDENTEDPPPAAVKPPEGDGADIKDRPDLRLRSAGHAPGADKVAEPVRQPLRWLLWTVFGACILGLFTVAGNMAAKHKRSEAGAHATGIGWVLLACVMAGSGMAIAFVSLLVDPL